MMFPYFTDGRTNAKGALQNIREMLTERKGARPGYKVPIRNYLIYEKLIMEHSTQDVNMFETQVHFMFLPPILPEI